METQTIEQKSERIIPIDDFARQQQLSRRTVDRYIQIGRIKARKIKGKTFVVDSQIEPDIGQLETTQKPQSSTTQTVQPKMTPKITPMTKLDWAQFGLLTAHARAKRIWQVVALVSIVCFIAAAAAAGWSFSNRRIQLERQVRILSKVQREHNRLIDQLQTENNQLTIENATLKAQNNLISSNIESLKASAENKPSQPVSTLETPSP